MTYIDPHSDQDISDILHNVKTIALVGASNKEDRPSYRVMKFLQDKGYKVIPVSPRLAGQTLLGEHVYESLETVPSPVDMVDLFVNADRVATMINEAIALSPNVIWMQIGVVDAASATIAKQAGIDVVMDRCPKKEIARLGLFS